MSPVTGTVTSLRVAEAARINLWVGGPGEDLVALGLRSTGPSPEGGT